MSSQKFSGSSARIDPWRLRTVGAAVLCLGLAAAIGQAQAPKERDRPAPHYDYRERAQPYAGPGREDADFEGLTEAVFGYFGPSDPVHPEFGNLWQAALAAVEDLNELGGCRGLPVRLEPAWSENPWGSGISRVARMIYSEPVLALIASGDGASAHLAEQVAAKGRVPLVNPSATDRTVNLANVPWMFSFLPGEQDQLDPLITALLRRVGGGRYLVVSALDHDSRVFSGELRRLLSRRGSSPAYQIEVEAGGDFDLLDRLEGPDLRAVILVAGPTDSARLLRGIRSVYAGPVFGTVAMGRRSFLDQVHGFAGELIFPYPAELSAVERFSETLELRTGAGGDFAAAQSYDAVWLLCKAVDRAGFNRARIHDALRDLSPWSGPAAGMVEWDRTGQNTRRVVLARVHCSESARCRVLPLNPADAP